MIIGMIFWSCQVSQEDPKTNQAEQTNDLNQIKYARLSSFDKWMQNPQPLISAHRGGPYPGFPENAIETFENVAKKIPVIIECDVSMTKDSVLVLMHDQTLGRTTTGDGILSDKSYVELQTLRLLDNDGDTTLYEIPTLEEVLAWGKGKVLFTLDVKRGVPFEKVLAAITEFDAISYAAVITYNIRDAVKVNSINSEVVISVSAGDDDAIEQILKSGIPAQKLLGFVGTREPEASHYKKLKELGIRTILGTLGNLDRSAVARNNDSVYLTYISNGANILATDRPLEVARVLEAANISKNPL